MALQADGKTLMLSPGERQRLEGQLLKSAPTP